MTSRLGEAIAPVYRAGVTKAFSAHDGRAIAALGIGAVGGVLWLASIFRPALMPFWLPWDFSPLWYTAFAATLFFYWRGCRIVRPRGWRVALFAAGMLAIWIVIQTRYEYLALHMFFYNRLQHMVMHHLGPFLIALAWPWPTILAGMPPGLQRLFRHRWTRGLIGWCRRPLVAAALFVALLLLWLIPAVHLFAMLSPLLYPVMNWSMVIDGLLFWSLVVDLRAPAEAGVSFVARMLTAIGVMFPQIAIGAYLCLTNRDLYGFYDWCGRLYAWGDPLADQRIGGIVVWESPGMMTVAAFILLLNALRSSEEAAPSPSGLGMISSAAWTGR